MEGATHMVLSSSEPDHNYARQYVQLLLHHYTRSHDS
jgi:hypothetical protein